MYSRYPWIIILTKVLFDRKFYQACSIFTEVSINHNSISTSDKHLRETDK